MRAEQLIEAAGWMLAHFIWQAALVALVLLLVLKLGRSAQSRYWASAGAMASLVLAAGATFLWHWQGSPGEATAAGTVEEPNSRTISPVEPAITEVPEQHLGGSLKPTDGGVNPSVKLISTISEKSAATNPLPQPTEITNDSDTAWHVWIVAAWLCGVGCFALRFIRDLGAVRTLKRTATRLTDEPQWRNRFTKLCGQVGIASTLPLLRSTTIRVPVALGVLKPVVIVPAAMLSGMSPAQVDAILLHELAHVRRHDFLVNILQSIIETVFFFHPAVWWISARMRDERENCCDDIATAACGDVVGYAGALAALEENRGMPDLIPAADGGNPGKLLGRIRRLANRDRDHQRGLGWPVALLSVLAAIALVASITLAMSGISMASEKDQEIPEEAEVTKPDDTPEPDVAPDPAGDALPAPAAAPAAPPEIADHRVQISGKLIDAATGAVVKQAVVIQAGMFDKANPEKVSWGFSESRSSRSDGTFSASVNWPKGWTARVLADGYLPKPVLTEAPEPGVDKIEIVLLMIKDRPLSGRVLDHRGEPVAGASVFSNTPSGLKVFGGKARNHDGDEDPKVIHVKTDADGRFEELYLSGVNRIAVSTPNLDAWPINVAEDNRDVEIRLPEPATLVIDYDIPGAPEEVELFFQRLGFKKESPWERLEIRRDIPIKRGRTEIKTLPPGPYQLARQTIAHFKSIGYTNYMERQFFTLEPGEEYHVDWTRKDGGARVKAKLTWPDGVVLEGIKYALVSKIPNKDLGGLDSPNMLDGGTVDLTTGELHSALTPPGDYELTLSAQKPIPEERLRMSGLILPDFLKSIEVTIPEGEKEVLLGDITLDIKK